MCRELISDIRPFYLYFVPLFMENLFTSCFNIHFFPVYVMLKWAQNSLFYQVNSFTNSENDNNYSWNCCQSPSKALSLPWHMTFLDNTFANNFNQNFFLSCSSIIAWDMYLNSTPILVYLYQRYLWKCSLSRKAGIIFASLCY